MLEKPAKRFPQKKWGPALLPAPTAPSEGSAGVRNLAPGGPFSILAHQLRRRLPSNCSLLRGARPTYSNDNPEDHQSFALSGLARKPKPSDVPRPFLGKLLPRPALPFAIRKPLEPRRATGRNLFRRLPGWPRFRSRKSFCIACRQRSDLWSPAAPACRCRLLGRLGPPSRSPSHHAHVVRVAKAKNMGRSLWITGISGTTVGTLSQSPIRDSEAGRRGCRSVPPRLLPPSA